MISSDTSEGEFVAAMAAAQQQVVSGSSSSGQDDDDEEDSMRRSGEVCDEMDNDSIDKSAG